MKRGRRPRLDWQSRLQLIERPPQEMLARLLASIVHQVIEVRVPAVAGQDRDLAAGCHPSGRDRHELTGRHVRQYVRLARALQRHGGCCAAIVSLDAYRAAWRDDGMKMMWLTPVVPSSRTNLAM